MSKLLSDRIKELHLRPNAPYPSEISDAHEFVRRWRMEQRLRLITEDNPREDYDDDEPEAA